MDSPPTDSMGDVVTEGAAVVVATVGTDGRPAITRGWGQRFDDDSSMLEVAVTAPAGSATLTNLHSNGAIAVTISEVPTYRTVQLKGRVEHVGAPSSDDRRRVQAHVARFAVEAMRLGVPPGAERLFLGDLRIVSVRVDERWAQSPGPDAGRPLT